MVRVMSGVGPRSSCRSLFRKLNILPISCHYILPLMLFIVDNQKDFLTNAYGLWFRHQKQKSFLFTCKFILCSNNSFILWGQNV